MVREISTTGIGSLPFQDVDVALDHVFKSYDIPFMPQLPKLWSDGQLAPMVGEIMTPAMLAAVQTNDGSGLVRALLAGVQDPGTPLAQIRSLPAYAGFVARAGGHERLKAQLVGPMTAAAAIEARLGVVPGLQAALRNWLACLSIAWCELLKGRSQTYLIWDEGAFVTKWSRDDHYVFRALRGRIAKNATILGIHSCTPGALMDLRGAAPDTLLAIDLNVVDVAQAKRPDANLIHGVLDTRSSNSTFPEGRKNLALARALAGDDGPLIISGGCGTGLHSEDYEIALAAALRELCRDVQ